MSLASTMSQELCQILGINTLKQDRYCLCFYRSQCVVAEEAEKSMLVKILQLQM